MLHLLPLLVDELFLLAPDLLRSFKRLKQLPVVDLEALVLLVQLVRLPEVDLVPLQLELEVLVALLEESDAGLLGSFVHAYYLAFRLRRGVALVQLLLMVLLKSKGAI